jgi:serine/threonine-protein kinase
MSGIPAGAGSLLGKRLGKYEILALLALGGTAEIYLARIGGAAGFEKYVVVKCLHDHLADDQTFVKMFLDEARLAAMLDHSNIVQTMELGEYENRYFMVMEFLAGLSLAMVVRRAGERLQGGRVPPQLVLNMMAQACAGLHYAHERTAQGKPLNMVHRDISPQNLVITLEGVVKVVDFGIAKAEHRETKTQSGTIKGKFAYMSPEQCVAANVDRRTDVFALGVIAWELLVGRRLFKKASPYETYQAVIDCNVPLPSAENVEIDPALDPIVMKALAKDKEQRYQTAEEFGDALLGYLHHRGKGSSPNDVSRFFDQHFGQEIEEHGARMRELISGRGESIDTGAGWDDEDEPKGRETVDLSGRPSDEKSLSLNTSDLIMDEQRPTDGEDDMPAERTRIEANPLEKLRELEAVQVARTGQTGKSPVVDSRSAPTKETPRPEIKKGMPPSGPLPLPAPPAVPPSGPRVVITPPGTPKAPSSGKFPDLSNLPTMIAEPEETPHPAELAPTAMAGQLVDPNARTSMEMQAQQPPPNGQMQRPPSQQMPRQSMQQLAQNQPPQPPPRPSNLPMGYPVMDKQMSQQMAAGATVFPDMQRAADLASPVGPGFGADVDWAQAAARPAKAIPPWMLGAFFVGAIAVALLVTLLIAKIAS